MPSTYRNRTIHAYRDLIAQKGIRSVSTCTQGRSKKHKPNGSEGCRGQRRGVSSWSEGGAFLWDWCAGDSGPLGCMFEGRRGVGQGALGWEAGRTVDRGAGEGQAPKEQGVTPLGAQSTPTQFPDGPHGELREHPQGFQNSPGIRHHTTTSMTNGQDSLTLNKIYSGLNFRRSVEGRSFSLRIGPGRIFAFFYHDLQHFTRGPKQVPICLVRPGHLIGTQKPLFIRQVT